MYVFNGKYSSSIDGLNIKAIYSTNVNKSTVALFQMFLIVK